MSSVGDYYHTFVGKVAEKDKFKNIEDIKLAPIPLLWNFAQDYAPFIEK